MIKQLLSLILINLLKAVKNSLKRDLLEIDDKLHETKNSLQLVLERKVAETAKVKADIERVISLIEKEEK